MFTTAFQNRSSLKPRKSMHKQCMFIRFCRSQNKYTFTTCLLQSPYANRNITAIDCNLAISQQEITQKTFIKFQL